MKECLPMSHDFGQELVLPAEVDSDEQPPHGPVAVKKKERTEVSNEHKQQ
jgi:hypothetical protein